MTFLEIVGAIGLVAFDIVVIYWSLRMSMGSSKFEPTELALAVLIGIVPLMSQLFTLVALVVWLVVGVRCLVALPAVRAERKELERRNRQWNIRRLEHELGIGRR